MTTGTTDKVKGAIRQAKGKAKKKVGEITDNPKLEAEGVIDIVAGKAQAKIGDVKKALDK